MHPVILILGPTAGGKTALSIALAQTLPGGGECISADSMQIYRGMDIGTAKPTAAERAAAPHHLLDLVDPSEDGFSVDRWLEEAERAIDAIRGAGRWPIVVGGTNLYVQAFMEGMFDGPEPDLALRERLRDLDPAERRAWLERVDPAGAARIHANDTKRTIRAIEVHELTGTPISVLQQQWHAGRPRRDVRIIGLDWPVEAINRRINARVREMIDGGLLEEVRALHAAGGMGAQARAALGYAQMIEVIEGRLELDEAVERIKIATRRFAKQQRTWLRRFRRYPGATSLAAAELPPQLLARQALAAILAPPSKVPPEGPSGGSAE